MKRNLLQFGDVGPFCTGFWEVTLAVGLIRSVNCRYITEDDLMRFMPEEDAIRALALFDGAMETGKITKKALKSWVVCAACLPDISLLNIRRSPNLLIISLFGCDLSVFGSSLHTLNCY